MDVQASSQAFSRIQAAPPKDTSLNVSHSTFGILLQRDFHVGGGDVAFLLFVPPDPRPAIALVFLNDEKRLAFGDGNGSFILT